MHYFIDGYNMLFRLYVGKGLHLKTQRQHIISALDQKLSLVRLNVSIVFDSAFQHGESSCVHFNNLEIFFTSYGETADDFILQEIATSSSPQQQTVVTSDKKLAGEVRRCFAKTESVEEFLERLDRIYQKKLLQSKSKHKKPAIQDGKIKNSSTPAIPSDKVGLESCQDHYEKIFTSRFEAFLKQKNSASSIVKAPTEMERWLEIFEKRYTASS